MSAFRPRAFAIRLASAKATVPAPASTPIALPYDLNITRALDGGESSIGGFDNQGTAIDAATLPETISNNGVSFNLSAGDNKAVIASGQTIKIPAGKGGKLYIVAASSGDDTAATFLINGKPVTKIIQAWDGYIGQNDLRLWNGEQPELTYGWDLKTIGLLPGYIKRAPVAWYADHKMLPNGKPDYYGFCYLYRYEFDVPAQGGTLTLPKNQQVKIVAASIASPAADTITPSEPLYDVLNHASDKGALRVETDTVNDGKDVKFTVNNQTFFTPSETIHYTLDGQTPTISSPVYKEPLLFSQKATLKAAVYDENGVVESTGSASASVQTPQAPTLTGITHISPKVILLKFSESISKESAENTSNYTISPAANIASAALNPDGSSVTLTLAANLLNSTPGTVSVSGIKANLPDGLSISTPEETTLSAVGLVYQQDATATFDKSSKEIVKQNLPGLPVLGESSWTISAYITPGKLEDLTAIVGFGAGADDSKTNRYIINYNGGISFWGSNVDIPTGVPFEEGKGVLVTMTFDGSAVRIYKNGQFLTSGDADFVTAQPTVILAPNGPWDLGRRFTGSISNFKIWNYALPEDEVKALVSTDAK
jgi:alpha-mannosidase